MKKELVERVSELEKRIAELEKKTMPTTVFIPTSNAPLNFPYGTTQPTLTPAGPFPYRTIICSGNNGASDVKSQC
jgi:uncharacterized surface protein with fasciclin (FAS1) repeats